MTQIFNRKEGKKKRRHLRKNMTKAEVLLWLQLKNRKMLGYRFLRQYGVMRYDIDFYCPKLKLAIEVDGDTHYVAGAEEYDRERQQFIEAFGITFLRFMNTDVYENLDGVCSTIIETMEKLAGRIATSSRTKKESSKLRMTNRI